MGFCQLKGKSQSVILAFICAICIGQVTYRLANVRGFDISGGVSLCCWLAVESISIVNHSVQVGCLAKQFLQQWGRFVWRKSLCPVLTSMCASCQFHFHFSAFYIYKYKHLWRKEYSCTISCCVHIMHIGWQAIKKIWQMQYKFTVIISRITTNDKCGQQPWNY